MITGKARLVAPIIQAIQKYYPEAQFSITGEETYENLNWISTDIEKPSEAWVTEKAAEIQAELDSTQYYVDRQKEYPTLADFADAYYWAQKGDNTKMAAYIAACDQVKETYPKP